MANLVILTAEELKALNPLARQAARWAARQQPLVRLILRTFLEQGGPIPVEDVIAASPDGHVGMIHDALVALDDEDLIRVRAGQIDIAYPFSAAPTPFRLRLSGGRERYACCALDALGIAPMVGEPMEISSQCHHCGDPLEFSATPDRPGPEAEGIMVWFGQRGDERCKVADSL
ncbi:MAG: organomercurial lyase [Candidatus Rokuibacteriota bacterium]